VTCPNLPDDAPDDATGCDGTAIIAWTVDGADHPVPCGWCWRAAGYDGPLIPDIKHLVRLRVARDVLVAVPDQPALFDTGSSAPEFDRCCAAVRRAGITDAVRDAWLAWIDQRTAEVAA
jgi:hypothetical protein